MVWCGKGHTGAKQHELAPAELFDRVDGDEAREKVLGACTACRQQYFDTCIASCPHRLLQPGFWIAEA